MKEFVELTGEPELIANSLILIGLTFRTFSAVVSVCVLPPVVQETLPTRSPLKAAGPEVTLKVALTFAPGATGAAIVVVPEATAVHPVGTERLNLTPAAGAPVVLVNVTAVSCEDRGENVWSPGGGAAAGPTVSRGTPYLAATTLACTNWSVASVGKVPAAVIAPS